jgi:hypothetical protein
MAFSGSQTTRLGVSGFTRGLYGSFAGKVESAAIKGIPVFAAGEVYLPGFPEGQVFTPGFPEGDVFTPGFQQGESV